MDIAECHLGRLDASNYGQTATGTGSSHSISFLAGFAGRQSAGTHRGFLGILSGETIVREFAQPLIEGMISHLPEIDERIRRYSENFDFNRISAVDRNVMRLAIYEMLYRDDIPPVVSINEAIELAKTFGGAESGRFVNGILDRVRKDLTRPAREAVKKEL